MYSENLRTEYLKAPLDPGNPRPRFYLALLAYESNPILQGNMRLLQQGISRPIMESYHIPQRIGNYYFSFVKSGFLTVTWTWLKASCPESPRQLAEIINIPIPDWKTYYEQRSWD